MKESTTTSVVIKENLTQKDYDEIQQLQSVCLHNDHTSLKLEVEYKFSRAERDQRTLKANNEFMYYENGALIGYIGICQFGGLDLEVNGMVHPDFRRRGIFTELYSRVKEEFHKRTCNKMLLLSDRHSVSGQGFIKTTGALYDASEYEMVLKNPINQINISSKTMLRKATNEDAKEIASQNAIYFGDTSSEEQMILPEEEEKSGFTIYMAELGSKIIGKVHLELNQSRGGIYGLGVLPEYRGRGYGREILQASIAKLKEKNAEEIMLQVNTKNGNALNLYTSCGFETTSTMDYFAVTKQ